MELDGARVLVAGATGVLGGLLADALADEGAVLAVGGRDPDKLEDVAGRLEAVPVRFDCEDLPTCADAVDAAAEGLGGLDGLVVLPGVPAFGPAAELDVDVARRLMLVDALGPIELVRAALPHLAEGDEGAVLGISAVVAEYPTAGMAAYSAAKAAFSAYLSAVRREYRRQGVAVVDARPPHLDTGFSDRALVGEPPQLPPGMPAADLVPRLVEALRVGRTEVAWDVKASELVVR